VNVAVELNGQPPLQAFIRPVEKPVIVLRSIDLGEREEIATWEQLALFSGVGSAFAIPKAALVLTGFHPDHCPVKYASLEEQLRDLGGRYNIMSAIPKGSGLDTVHLRQPSWYACGFAVAWLGQDAIATDASLNIATTGGGWQDHSGGYCRVK
jgi:hypothetical protein